jgi:hypothetical protein
MVAEPVPYSAQLSPGTWNKKSTQFTATAPGTSPFQTIDAERNRQISLFFEESVKDSLQKGIRPSSLAVENFNALVRLLPSELPATDPYISEAGSICFDWDDNPLCQLSILLQDKQQIAFAAYFRGERIHGSARFFGTQLPYGLLDLARRWSQLRSRRHSDQSE